ncbi:myxococcus cysteine-rich repeat containing protein [Enhygromyxa salina]|uniref:myxococcus cysteine-rich repeat containing protein n=1 Tax=Enhygromyxa salina TaxID=215803 RepID=UPI001F0AA1E8|nr:myxococcus cysteine-rich repeat containing protein [Enhygromyxa salina]
MFGNNPSGNAGTMNSVLGANNGAYREWRRDDIDGLSALYPHRSTELVFWDDIIFPQAPLESDLVSIVGAESIRTPSPSSVAVAGGSAYFAAVDTAHRVVLYEDSGAGFTGPEVIDPGASGLTWGNPALALGVDTVFVLWASAEQPDSLQVVRRWAVRDVQGMTWSYGQDSPSPGARRYGAAYATTDYFVAATTHNSSLDFPIVTTFDTAGDPVDEVELDFRVFDLGSGTCTGDLDLSICLLPYSTETFAGPDLGYLELLVDAAGTLSIAPSPVESDVPARGKMALANRSESEVRGTAGHRRYALLTPDAVPAPAPVPLPLINGDDWPVAMGASSRLGATPHWFGLSRRSVVCGNEVVQGGEQCDDGNVINGDGCDASCAVEPAGDTGGATSETGGSDDLGGSELGGDGCECRVHRRASPAALLLVLPALFYRRRCSRGE